MTIKDFISKACEGGWMDKESAWMDNFDKKLWAEQTSKIHRAVCEILLDPRAWQAVGEVEGWKNICSSSYGCDGKAIPATGLGKVEFLYQCSKCRGYLSTDTFPFRVRMHRFIDALCDGKDLSASLEDATV